VELGCGCTGLGCTIPFQSGCKITGVTVVQVGKGLELEALLSLAICYQLHGLKTFGWSVFESTYLHYQTSLDWNGIFPLNPFWIFDDMTWYDGTTVLFDGECPLMKKILLILIINSIRNK